jgi:hypothetical protein
MDGLIHYVCEEHLQTGGAGPFITRVDGEWGYCTGHGRAGHRWRAIEPTRREALERRIDEQQLADGGRA